MYMKGKLYYSFQRNVMNSFSCLDRLLFGLYLGSDVCATRCEMPLLLLMLDLSFAIISVIKQLLTISSHLMPFNPI